MAVAEVPARIVDCQGLQCPTPVLKIAQAIKDIEPGQVIELLATDAGVDPDMHAWTKRTGNELLGIEKDEDVFHVFVRRN